MNFLAHLFLAGEDEELLIGNFIADSVKGNKYITYPDRISKGILMHREIDFFSDNNPVYLQSVHRLQPDYGKYSGIITDMFYDYFLANNWDTFSNISLEEFCTNTYKVLYKYLDKMPKESLAISTYMSRENWLLSYREKENIRGSLAGMSRRMKYYFPMDNAAIELEKNPEPYNQDFLDFFPLLIKHIAPFKG
ncbi:MAG TPA: ACP phosphodiesterase [Bacteroidia bacterium]|jgi:acyl carrier protein phosphodiesterase|nr:ACP phosphodiesterase [Bacteroidia bacterium]